jgi:SMI1-KNR4 cell-wall
MWQGLINGLRTGCQFADPANPDSIRQAEGRLSIKFPQDLFELLSETNGVISPSGTSLIWPVDRITLDNIELRTFPDFPQLYMPFDHLLFFGDDGSGDLYAFRILAGIIRYSDIYEWIHENDSRQWFAGGLRDYLARSLGYDSYLSAIRSAP